MSSSGKSNNFFWGSILILLGVLFLFQNLDIFDLGDIIARYWPVILILFGLKILWRYRQKPENHHYNSENPSSRNTDSGNALNNGSSNPDYTITNVLGDINRNFDNQEIQHFFSSNVFGDTFLNFSNTRFPESASIRISGVFGDIDIRLPDDLMVEITSNYVAGSAKIFDSHESGVFKKSQYKSPEGKSKKKKLNIDISIVFGDILVRH